MGKPAVVQSAPEDPKYLFDPDNAPERTYLSNKFVPFTGALLGFLLGTMNNYAYRRPYFAGLPKIVGLTVVGFAGALWYDQMSDRYFAERDAVYRHYIELHPEDFQPKERILVGDMFKTWVPIR